HLRGRNRADGEQPNVRRGAAKKPCAVRFAHLPEGRTRHGVEGQTAFRASASVDRRLFVLAEATGLGQGLDETPVVETFARLLHHRKHCVPKGHFENSPAFERRGIVLSQTSPGGTAAKGVCFRSSLRDVTFSPVCPGTEMPGYFRLFLRNRMPA